MAISQNFPTTRPSLNLNFARSRKLDSRVTFTRGSTGTYVDESGLIRTAGINEARFDYDPISGESLGLLVEESRSNLLQYSQALATSPWGIFNGGGFSVSNNVTTSPDGTSNASQINCTSWTGGDSVYQDVSASGTGTYTLSIFVKGNSCNAITLSAFFTGNSTQGFSFGYNPLTGQITGTGGGSNHTVVSYSNGWYRIYFTVTGTNALNNTLRFQVYANTTGITYLWGAQLEAGAFPTSYIPTSGSTATRSADNASITGTNFTDFYNQSEGTVYAQFRCDSWNDGSGYNRVYVVSSNDGSENDGFWIANDPLTDNSLRYRIRFGGVNQFGPENVVRSSNNIKVSFAVKTNDVGLISDGVLNASSVSALLPSNMQSIHIGSEPAGSIHYLNGTISQLTYYPVRLANSLLQNLTK